MCAQPWRLQLPITHSTLDLPSPDDPCALPPSPHLPISPPVQAVQPAVSPEELRLLIAYMSDYADTEHDHKTSLEELSTMLKPFYAPSPTIGPG